MYICVCDVYVYRYIYICMHICIFGLRLWELWDLGTSGFRPTQQARLHTNLILKLHTTWGIGGFEGFGVWVVSHALLLVRALGVIFGFRILEVECRWCPRFWGFAGFRAFRFHGLGLGVSG